MENNSQLEVVEDLRQTKEYGEYMESLGWKVAELGRCGKIFLRPLGPLKLAKFQRFTKIPEINLLDELMNKERVVMCKLEPSEKIQETELNSFTAAGFKKDKWPLLASKTLRVDLRPATEVIFSKFKKDARYCIRKVQEDRYKISDDDTELFYFIWKKSSKRKNLWIPSKNEYDNFVRVWGKKVLCITIGEMAGVVIIVHKQTAFYYYAGATKEGTDKNLPYLAVWSGMQEAKKRGAKTWDFEGIFDTRWPNKRWLGFSHFKKSFGGQDVEYPGSFEKWRWPF